MTKKSLKLRCLEKALGLMAKAVLWRHKPKIIGITGSVGKTTTKNVIVHILQEQRNIYYTKKNYNNEIGVPLTIMNIDHDVDSIGALFKVFLLWIKMMNVGFDYPHVIVIEMGVDRPGDMDYLTSIVKPDVAVLTSIAYAHSEFFDGIDEIAKEKQKIVTNMKKGGTAIINYDDKYVRSVLDKTKEKVITYGMDEKADFRVTDPFVRFHGCESMGLSFKFNYKGNVIPVRLDHIIAQHFIYAILAGLAIADVVEVSVIDAIGRVIHFKTSEGRMSLLEGKKDTSIIDDTYNASPSSMQAALQTLRNVPDRRRIVVLGDMRELGEVSRKEHENIAKQLTKFDVAKVFLVGPEMRYAYDILQKTDIFAMHFDNSNDAIDAVLESIEEGDIILVKGSRGIHMEYIVRELVKDTSKVI